MPSSSLRLLKSSPVLSTARTMLESKSASSSMDESNSTFVTADSDPHEKTEISVSATIQEPVATTTASPEFKIPQLINIQTPKRPTKQRSADGAYTFPEVAPY